MTNFRGSKSADTGHEQHFWIYSGTRLKFAFQYGVRDAHIYAYYIVHRGRYWQVLLMNHCTNVQMAFTTVVS